MLNTQARLRDILECESWDEHLHGCRRHFKFFSLNNLPERFHNKADLANFTSHFHQTILNINNVAVVAIIACNNNYNQFCFLKSLLIKRYKPQLNYGIKAAKDIVLLWQLIYSLYSPYIFVLHFLLLQ